MHWKGSNHMEEGFHEVIRAFMHWKGSNAWKEGLFMVIFQPEGGDMYIKVLLLCF